MPQQELQSLQQEPQRQQALLGVRDSELSRLLGDSSCTSLIYLDFLSLGSLLGLDGVVLEGSLLSFDLGIALSLPVIPLLIGLCLSKSSLGYATIKMMTKKNSFIRKNTTSGKSLLSTYFYPSKSALKIENDSCRVGVRVVRADLLDETTVAIFVM